MHQYDQLMQVGDAAVYYSSAFTPGLPAWSLLRWGAYAQNWTDIVALPGMDQDPVLARRAEGRVLLYRSFRCAADCAKFLLRPSAALTGARCCLRIVARQASLCGTSQ